MSAEDEEVHAAVVLDNEHEDKHDKASRVQVVAAAAILASDVRFSSSPNWYCSKVMDSDGDRLLAFGSRNGIVLLDVNDYAALSRKTGTSAIGRSADGCASPIAIRLLNNLHSERVSGVSFEKCLFENVRPPDGRLLLATVGDDLLVNVVDLRPRCDAGQDDSDGYRLIGHHREHKEKIAAVTWSTGASEVSSCVLSGDEKGNLISFNVASGKIVAYKPYHAPAGPKTGNGVMSMAVCPSKPNVVAVGYRGGLIVVTDLRARNGQAMWLLRHHDDDIQSLCWAPFVGLGPLVSTFERAASSTTEESDEDHLFVSASKDRTFRVWSIKQGAPVRTFNLPTNSRIGAGRKQRAGEEYKVYPWLTVHWSRQHSHTLLAASHLGELICFDLRSTDRAQHASVVGVKEGKGHSRTIFNIATCKEIVCTVSMDRQIMFWDVDAEPNPWILTMPTLGGHVYNLTFSPVNSGYMAIGCGDNVIRTWNTTSTSNPFEVQSFWQGIKSKVTALSWHPQKEGLLAFGTMEGRVAICNVLGNKVPLLSKNFHRKVVYTLTWGPVCPINGDHVGQWRLYSCGDGSILVHDANKLEASALNLDKLISGICPSKVKAAGRTDVAFKPDFSILILGNDDGTIELYDAATLMLRLIVCAPRKLIQCIRWHPSHTTNSSVESTCRFWLAVASRDFTLHVHDLAQLLDDGSNTVSIQKKSSASFELVGHGAAVATIAWNPHRDGQLVSASFDGTVRVWNVVAMETLACFCGHFGRVLCAEWSPLDPDLVASGGEDFTVRMWKVSEQPRQLRGQHILTRVQSKKPIKKYKARDAAGQKEELILEEGKQFKTEVDEEDNEQLTKVESNPIAELEELLEQRRQEILKGAAGRSNLETNGEKENAGDDDDDDGGGAGNCKRNLSANKDVYADRDLGPRASFHALTQKKKKSDASQKKKRGFKSMFPLSNSRENHGLKQSLLNDCIVLADRVAASSDQPRQFDGDELLRLGAYGGRLDAYKLLKIEGENHLKSDNIEYAMQLDLWKGNVAGVIRNAAARDQLNDWLLAMAPIVSHSFWEEMCDSYSKQLVTNGQPHKAVTFLLAHQKVQEAIEVLRTNVSHKEAIVLAKIRLPTGDPSIQEMTEEWAAHLEREGQGEQAVKCHLSLGRVEKAATVLAQRQDAPSLRAAAYVMRRGSGSDAPMLADDYAARAAFQFLVNDDHNMVETVINENQVLKPFNLVIETHQLLLKSVSKDAPTFASKFAAVTSNSVDESGSRFPLLEAVHREWVLHCSSWIEDSDALDRAIALLSQDSFQANPLKISQMLAYLATKFTQVLVFALKSRFEDALRLVLKITVLLYRIGDPNVLVWLFGSVLPSVDGTAQTLFAFLNLDVGDRDVNADNFIESIRAYRDLTILREIGNRMKSLPVNPSTTTTAMEDSARLKTPPPASSTDEIGDIADKLMSTVMIDDQSDVTVLKLQLDNLKMAVRTLTEERKTEECDGIVSQLLVDAVIRCSSVDVNRNEAEMRLIAKRIKELLRRIPAVWSTDPCESNRLLVVGLAFLADREHTAGRANYAEKSTSD